MHRMILSYGFGALTATAALYSAFTPVQAQEAQKKPNILFIVSDDTGYGDLGPYGGGEGRGMPTPNIDALADEGMTFFSFYAQPSCTPGRAAMQTGRIPNRSGMTTVAFQGQGGGLPAAEWTLASVLKRGGYQTYFTGKWHLGEADYALPIAQGYDEMKYVGLYHLNAYTYADPTWFPDMDPELRAMFQKVTKGSLSGKAGGEVKEDFKINGQYVNTPVIDGKEGVVGIPFFDGYVEKAAIEFLDTASKKPDQPFFINVNFMKVHQPNMPAPEFEHKSLSKSKYADSIVELDTHIGRIMDKLRETGMDRNTLVFYTTDNGAWQDVYPDAGYTPFRGTKGTLREGGNRVPAIAVWPGKIKPDTKNHDIVGGLDLMATFASVGSVPLPDKDREDKPIIFDSYDMSPILLGTGKSARKSWFYFTENELSPGAIRVNNYKFAFNIRGDDGASTGGLAVDSNLGWKGAEKYVATVPQVFDLWQDPQERYDIFMNNFTERTWMGVIMGEELKKIMATYVQYPPRKQQSLTYTGPITLSNYERFQWVREQLGKEGVAISLPTGN
ncbi:arylsulfatase [Rhizobium leguminosarum]|uniref:Arylsulfatase n=2 Tax=Rhizobium/Agrobacterium group TaxID=227290 RepID=A0AAE2SXP1_RHILE|nr:MULTISPECIES: arylsulfatase [Rhizobium]MBB4290744.1 arylsulfatase [Rhizobium leguminosarum]MBB4307353.1 arylsulfatase [Rhizobium leguminosarum]MBB4415126.1 arylsulfatase [Rhizobium leguminosarum]MBB4431907.1 arylsulfatase [Rhizobium esperanzae]MBB4528510.1 arylsulfatase [Rhizobium leguminosarum]